MKNPFSKKKNNDAATGQGAGRFAENIARFFSAEPQKEKILRHEDFARAGDVYYATVSARYKVAQRILILLLVIFLLFSIFTNISNITYGNFFYFFRDFGNAVDIESSNYESLSYDVYGDQSFALYRGGIAAVSPSNVSVFTATGRRTLKSRSDFALPYAVCSKKYALVYDVSGKSFALYNSFSKIYTESFDYPISDAAISDSGVFAVLTRSADYKSVVNVYNKNVKLAGRYSKDMYALDIAIDSAGERMAVVYYDIGDGLGRTVLRVYDISNRVSEGKDPDEDRVMAQKTFEGEFPLGCAFMSDGKLSVATNGSVSVLDNSEYEVYDYITFNGELRSVYASEDGVAVAVKEGVLNDVNTVIAFDKHGKVLYNELVRESVREIAVLGRHIFIKTDSGVARINADTGEEEELASQTGKMLIYDESTAIVCGESKAVYIKFKES